ncbi:MAG TPA: CPBP family intramembrane glutamic endopeptidase [Phycisphaerae bacterium]|nr:CPBP family intramembrane glutamic endopeptidase [Phycisphaerae bacterium]
MRAISKTFCAAGGANGQAGPTREVTEAELWLLSVGIVALAVWVVVRIARPNALRLARTPGRPNSLTLVHVVAIYLLNVTAGLGAYELFRRVVQPSPTADPAARASVVASVVAAEVGMWPAPAGYFALAADDAFAALARRRAAGQTLAMIVSGAVTLAVALAVAARAFSGGLRRGLGLSGRRWLWDAARAAVSLLIVWPLCWGAMYAMEMLIQMGLPVPRIEHPLLKFLPMASTGWRLLIVLGAVVMAPLAEEVMFRGLLQSLLRRHCPNPWWAIGITSAIFAFSHLGLYRDWPALFILSVALGYNYERTGRLIAPIGLHALFNAASIAITLWR